MCAQALPSAEDENRSETLQPAVEQVVFIVDPDVEVRRCVRYVLVRFSGYEKDERWLDEPIKCSQTAYRLYHDFFIIAVCARQYFAEPRQVSPIELVYHGEPVPVQPVLQRNDPVFGTMHDKTVSHWLAALGGHPRKRRRRYRYPFKEPLLSGVRELLFPHGSHEERPPFVAVSEQVKPDTFLFFKPTAMVSIPSARQKKVSVHLDLSPSAAVALDAARAVAERISAVQPIRRPRSVRSQPVRAHELKEVGAIRRDLLANTLAELRSQIRSDNIADYIDVPLQIAGKANDLTSRPYAPRPPDDSQDERGDEWRDANILDLLSLRGTYLVTGPCGAGKSTFLRFLQTELLGKTAALAFYVDLGALPIRATESWGSLRHWLVGRRVRKPPGGKLASAVDKLLHDGNVVLLVDGLTVEGSPATQKRLHAIRVAAAGAQFVLAGRPAALRWLDIPEPITHVRLQPFDLAGHQAFFKQDYDRAVCMVGEDQGLLSIPMFAYLVRTLVQTGAAEHVRSRWDLYSRYFDHLLYRHPSNRQRRHHNEWATRTLQVLTEVSFRAIDASPPHLGLIPWRFLRTLATPLRHELAKASAAGLADFIQERSDAHGPSLVFSHQSFQEALAARAIVECEERQTHVLKQSWNVKWHDVLLFAAGRAGQRIVETLYPPRATDTPIHSRLFLAGACASQTNLTDAQDIRLVRALRLAGQRSTFAAASSSHLAAIGSVRSKNAAWGMVKRRCDLTPRGTVESDPIEGCSPAAEEYIHRSATKLKMMSTTETNWVAKLDRRTLHRLYSPERLKWVIAESRHAQVADVLEDILIAWCDRLSASEAQDLLRHGRIPLVRLEQVFAMAKRLGAKGFDGLLQALHAKMGPSPLPGSAIGSAPSDSIRLTSEQLSALITGSASLIDPIDTCRYLDRVVARLSDEHISMFRDLWWRVTDARDFRWVLAEFCPRVVTRFPDRCLCELLEAVKEPGRLKGWQFREVLRHCRNRLSKGQKQEILDLLHQQKIWSGAIDAIIAVSTGIDGELGRRLLNHLGDEDLDVRLETMYRMRDLKPHATRRHVHVLENNLRRGTEIVWGADGWIRIAPEPYSSGVSERQAAIDALVQVGDLVSQRTIKNILDTLPIDRYFYAQSGYFSEPSLRYLAGRANDECVRTWLEEVCTPRSTVREREIFRDPGCIRFLCALLPPQRLNAEAIMRLGNAIHERHDADMSPVLDLLRALEESHGIDLGRPPWLVERNSGSATRV